jgi:hypothetical protein
MNTTFFAGSRPAFLKPAAVLCCVTLLGLGATQSALGATSAADKAKGEELLTKARQELAEAKHLDEVALRATQIANRDQATAQQKRNEARNLVREAFQLIRDSNRLHAAELRSEAEAKELQAKTDETEVQRLQTLLGHQKQVAADATAAANKTLDAVRNEPDANEKAQLAKMVETLRSQAAHATADAAPIEARIKALQADVAILVQSAKNMNAAADKLSPAEK